MTRAELLDVVRGTADMSLTRSQIDSALDALARIAAESEEGCAAVAEAIELAPRLAWTRDHYTSDTPVHICRVSDPPHEYHACIVAKGAPR